MPMSDRERKLSKLTCDESNMVNYLKYMIKYPNTSIKLFLYGMNDMCIFGLYYHAISTIGKYEEALQNKYTCAPNLIELRAGPGIEIYMGRNMNSSAKQIQSSVSPNLIVGLSPSLTLKAFLRRLLWNKVKKNVAPLQSIHTQEG